MKRFFRSPWFWLGVVALIGLIIWFFIPAYCFGGVFLWGVEAVVGVYLLLRRLSGKHPKAARRLRRAFTVCVALGLMAMSFTAGLIAQAGHGSPAVSCPVLIVPGAAVYGEQPSLALQERLTAALAYLQAHPETICIVSGGQGQGENITEAQCSYRWLTAHGIEESRLLLEEDSTSTQENLIYSMERSAAAGVSLEQPGLRGGGLQRVPSVPDWSDGQGFGHECGRRSGQNHAAAVPAALWLPGNHRNLVLLDF